MTLFFNHMLGCLLIAAGIGGAIGWLLRYVSAGKLVQQLAEVTAMMRLKEQMLEKARHQLREATSKTPSPAIDTDRLHSRGQESEAAGGWIEWLDIQLTQRDEQHRIALDEVMLQLAERDQDLERLHQQLRKQADAHEAFPTDKVA
jgi:hypothetical protein